MNIDYDRLRRDLVEYFGTASSINPTAIYELQKVYSATELELEKIAKRNGFNINNYEIIVKKYFKTLY